MSTGSKSSIEIGSARSAHPQQPSFPPHSFRRNSYIVRVANGLALAYVYFEEELGRRAAAKLAPAFSLETARLRGALLSAWDERRLRLSFARQQRGLETSTFQDLKCGEARHADYEIGGSFD